MKRKILSWILVMGMLSTSLPLAVSASTVASGECGDNLTWTFDDTGTLTISGTGVMYNFSYDCVPWDNYRGCIINVNIENGITSIGDEAFAWCEGLASITIPDSVTSIGAEAFRGCESLTNITIPEGVTSIGGMAFSDCMKLTDITVSEGNQAYCDLSGVLFNKDKTIIIDYPDGKGGTGYIIPNSVTSIGDTAFYYCTSLTSITIPEGVTNIGWAAFYHCTSLTSITIPKGVMSIGDGAFNDCESLASIIIPEGITSIGDGVFGFCKRLESITVPNSVTSIDEYAFYRCDSLTDVYYGGTQEQWGLISIGDENAQLTSANIHYSGNTTGGGGQMGIPDVEFNETSDKWNFNVDIDDCGEKVNIFLAICDKNGGMLDVDCQGFSIDDGYSFSFTKRNDAAYYKVFVLNKNLAPMYDVYRDTLE